MSGQPPKHGSTSRLPGRTVALIGVAVVALVATAVVVVSRLGGDGDIDAPGRTDSVSAGGRSSSSSVPAEPSAGTETSAATLLGWPEPTRVDDFDAPLGPDWQIYDGPGHVGNGIRSPDAVEVSDGVLTMTGDSAGTTGGMAWSPGRMYGRWEGRVRAAESDPTYNALLLLWPDAEDWPVGGEIDFMEMTDPTRQSTKIFLHWGEDNSQVEGEVAVDGTEWQNWAVEWTPEHIVAYLNGREWYRSTDLEVLPPRPMHLAIQFDWFPEQGDPESVDESSMQVDWVKEYPL